MSNRHKALQCVVVALVLLVIILTTHTWIPNTPALQVFSRRYSQSRVQTSSSSFLEAQELPALYEYDFPNLKLPAVLNEKGLKPLKRRLIAFLNRPVQDHHETIQNEDDCPLSLSDRLVDPVQFKNNDELWRYEIDKELIAEKRADLVLYLEKQLKLGRAVIGSQIPEEQRGTRGIVIAGGHQTHVRNGGQHVLTQIKMLRHHGCSLPIEVVHYKGELRDRGLRGKLEDLGAKLVKVQGIKKDLMQESNSHIKGVAIAKSSFQEVLFLDSDVYPVRDPTHLFESTEYRRHGAAFWPTVYRDHAHNAIWRVIGKQCTMNDFAIDSGIMLINKLGNGGLNLAGLWVASGMLDDIDFWYTVTNSGRDAFRWAFTALGLSYTTASRYPAQLGLLNSLDPIDKDRFVGHSLVQYDLVTPSGHSRPPPLFIHSRLLATLVGEDYTASSLFTHIKTMSLDNYAEPTLNQAEYLEYNSPWRGLASDLKIHRHGREHMTNDQRRKQQVVLQRVDEVEHEPFRGFGRLFFASGGRTGHV